MRCTELLTNTVIKILAAIVTLLILTALSHPSTQDPDPLILTHLSIVDVASGQLQLDRDLLISHGRISSIRPSAQSGIPSLNSSRPSVGNPRTIDARGKFLIPGLWDMHVHLAGISADPSWSKQVLLPLLLTDGITGVRDMGGDLNVLLDWKRQIEEGTLLGPHLVVSGPFLASGGEKTPEQFPVADAAQARAAVRELHDRGADFIKIISLPSNHAFLAVAGEARQQSIPFVGHLPFQVSATEASIAGMRSIEHLLYSAFYLSFSSDERDLRRRLVAAEQKGDSIAWEKISNEADATYSSTKAAALFRTLRTNHTFITPTLASLNITAHPETWNPDDPLLVFVPPALAKKWRDSLDDDGMKQRAAWLARQAANDWKLTRELHHAGVPMLVGSDSLDAFVFPGDSLHKELAELVRAGFTPAEALRAATLGAAQFLDREKDFGAVKISRVADLVILDANPLEDIANARKISAVIRGGQYFNRAALDHLNEEAKEAVAAAETK
jgi:imidazolonepropionase-like amidohydrolase